MTSPSERIEVKCPQCGELYEDWYRGSINLALEHFDDQYIEEATTATCPSCGHKVALDVLIVRENGVWEISD